MYEIEYDWIAHIALFCRCPWHQGGLDSEVVDFLLLSEDWKKLAACLAWTRLAPDIVEIRQSLETLETPETLETLHCMLFWSLLFRGSHAAWCCKVMLLDDRTLEFHSQYGRHHRLRVPKCQMPRYLSMILYACVDAATVMLSILAIKFHALSSLM